MHSFGCGFDVHPSGGGQHDAVLVQRRDTSQL
jgi:hypothetical protein